MTMTSRTTTRTLISRLTTPRTISPPLPIRYVDVPDRKRSGTLRLPTRADNLGYASPVGTRQHRGTLAEREGALDRKDQGRGVAANEVRDALDRIVASLQGGVQRLGIEAALPEIESWEEKLAALESPELRAVADNLGALKEQLLADDFDPAAVGQLLLTLGEQVRRVADGPAGTQAGIDRLSRLSVLLAREGESLSGR